MKTERFNDQNKRLTDFRTEVLVVCPTCRRQAVASVNYTNKKSRLQCISCGYNKEKTTETRVFGIKGHIEVAAHIYFSAELWLVHTFKDDVFWAYNYAHLDYLESYISAKLREHNDRSHFTLIEKLPKFYHDAKNRSALLKLINKMRKRSR
ncbi:hypothetical protein [Sphingobacterium sp. 2149]|uniref:hypothetical protein n=1 Tax=Sphingobacterium sp. 2149 TaxID=2817763 RepID=UPI00286612EB|nr:hypothetical protein [Sphingobacterium sp. 2149]MDR6733447.1 Zn ribbon nucleic-acid-binding protein [Sphingobacterium sp. 2149]